MKLPRVNRVVRCYTPYFSYNFYKLFNIFFFLQQDSLESSGRERMVATTTVTIPKEGPITTISVIGNHPGNNLSDQEQDFNPSSQRLRFVEWPLTHF